MAEFSLLHAVHAAEVAITISTPAAFNGDAEESTSIGVAEDALNAAGNVTNCASDVAFVGTVVEELQVVDAVRNDVVELHDPAVAAVVVPELKHLHEVQPAVVSADALQQQPPCKGEREGLTLPTKHESKN